MSLKKVGLLPRVIIAIILGVVCGNIFPLELVRVFETFNTIFSQYLGFMIPIIIIGLVTPAIAEIGSGAGKLLIVTILIAYFDTVFAGLLSYTTGSYFFPSMIDLSNSIQSADKGVEILPYFKITIPPIVDVMSALVLSFFLGLGIAYGKNNALLKGFREFGDITTKSIAKSIIPLLPIYIYSIFLKMSFSGEAYHIMFVFMKIIIVIFILHIVIILYSYFIAGALTKKNPIRLILNMLPAYATALGTSSSAATIPVALKQTLKNGVNNGIAGFVIPLCATVHLSGSAMKITACALTICLLKGMPVDFGVFFHFILMLGVIMVAAPGVPGGAIMAALAPLGSILGFGASEQALMIALYISMDSFGTACNVTGDGAIALIVDKIFKKSNV